MLPRSNIPLQLPSGNIQQFCMMKDREITEQKILDAVGSMIMADGFESLGINAVAQKAGVSKMLIYRYFGGMDQLIAKYILQHDYWVNTELPLHDISGVGACLKQMFREQIATLRSNMVLKRLHRWELTADNEVVRLLRERRETNGCELVRVVSRLTKSPYAEVAAMATLLSAAISYLTLIEEQNKVYNGIDLCSDEGWQQLATGIDQIIDLWVKNKQQ